MNHRGQSSIGIIGKFLIIVAIIAVFIAIWMSVADKFSKDADLLSACEARGAQAGGRGSCSTDQTCAAVSVGPNEYAWYLGTSCPVPENHPPQYCCVIISKNRNPPALPSQGSGGVSIPGQTTPILEVRYRLSRAGSATTPFAQDQSFVLPESSVGGLDLTTTFASKNTLACETIVEVQSQNADGSGETRGAVFTQCDGFFDFAARGLPVADNDGVAYRYDITTTMTNNNAPQPITIQGSINRGVTESAPVNEFRGIIATGGWNGCSDATNVCDATFAQNGPAKDKFVYNGRTVTGTTYICQINRVTGACVYTPASS